MAFRINPLWWPALAVASPLIVPFLAVKNRRFRENRTKAERINRERLERARPIELPALDFIELTVLAEWQKQEGFLGEPGVSYLFRTDMGFLFFDVGFGAECRLKSKGLAVFTGCGHPTIEVILEMVRRLSDEPLYAFGEDCIFRSPVGGEATPAFSCRCSQARASPRGVA
jgi:hypothetical protein